MSKHTPGPWEQMRGHPHIIVSYKSQTGFNEILIAEVSNNTYRDQGRHNISLIAAAPELLEALELLHNNFAEYQRINNMGGYDNHDMRMARAAIAKAKGETP